MAQANRAATRDATAKVQTVGGAGIFEYSETLDPTGNNNELTVKASFSHDGELILRYSITSSRANAAHVVVEYGRATRGVRIVDMTVQNDQITGNADGRTFGPVPVGTDFTRMQFHDGMPAPIATAKVKIRNALHDIARAGQAALEKCGTAVSGEPVTDTLALASPDTGHFSDTYDTLRCDGCKGLAVAGCSAGGVGCALATFGIGTAGCIAAAAACSAGGILACENSNACCPVACGGGFTCCFGDESCLNPSTGLCCDGAKRPCEGRQCCGAGESCIDQGPNRGVCCEDGLVCGQNCCPEGQNCLNSGTGLCCKPELMCGSRCCPDLTFCADASTGRCCTFVEENCGDVCCPSGQCQNGVCKPRGPRTQEECAALGLEYCVNANGELDISMCGEGEFCRAGCCEGIPR